MRFLHEFMAVLGQPMAIFGILGQSIFSARFIVQWIVSERRRESTIPVVFWYLSLGGGMLTAVYAIWRRDPVFSLAQLAGLIVYARNLMLIRRQARLARAATPRAPTPGTGER